MAPPLEFLSRSRGALEFAFSQAPRGCRCWWSQNHILRTTVLHTLKFFFFFSHLRVGAWADPEGVHTSKFLKIRIISACCHCIFVLMHVGVPFEQYPLVYFFLYKSWGLCWLYYHVLKIGIFLLNLFDPIRHLSPQRQRHLKRKGSLYFVLHVYRTCSDFMFTVNWRRDCLSKGHFWTQPPTPICPGIRTTSIFLDS